MKGRGELGESGVTELLDRHFFFDDGTEPGATRAPFMDFLAELKRLVARVERGIDLHVPRADTRPARLHAAKRYSLEAGGKPPRPAPVAGPAGAGRAVPSPEEERIYLSRLREALPDQIIDNRLYWFEKQIPDPIRLEAPKVGRNDPCPCGSGKKYKKCHGSPVRP